MRYNIKGPICSFRRVPADNIGKIPKKVDSEGKLVIEGNWFCPGKIAICLGVYVP